MNDVRRRCFEPPELIAAKIVSSTSRTKTAKGLTDGADVRRLLLAFPDLKSEEGPVTDCLRAANASEAAMASWKDVVSQEILPEDDDAGY